MTRRLTTAAVIATFLIAGPALASTEDTTPQATTPAEAVEAKKCPTGKKNADGTPEMADCPATAGAPPVNTIEDVYPAGSLRTLLLAAPKDPTRAPRETRPAERR